MKKTIVIILAMLICGIASAQYNASGSALMMKGTKVFADGERLDKDRICALLSTIRDDNGVGYDVSWKRYRSGYTAGAVLTSVGSVAAVAGIAAIGYGFALAATSGIAAFSYSLIFVFAGVGNMDGLDAMLTIASTTMTVGTITALAGAVMLGTGIPLLCVNKSRMKKAIRAYNDSSFQGAPNSVTLNFGAQPHGLGFALNF